MEGQVFILVIVVVAGLVSMVKKAIAEEKKKQEALIRAAQAKRKKKPAGTSPLQGETRIDRLIAEKARQEGLPAAPPAEKRKLSLRAVPVAATTAAVAPAPVFPDIVDRLQEADQLRELFVLKEVLDKPLALRRR